MQRRELKLSSKYVISCAISVASHAEAWIEIGIYQFCAIAGDRLPLMQRRELKLPSIKRYMCLNLVASHAEAWIEIGDEPETWEAPWVASHAEAWIEIDGGSNPSCNYKCCLSCRGVNWNMDANGNFRDMTVASHAEAWIEIICCSRSYWRYRLPLMQRRELKWQWMEKYLTCSRLPLMQRRELKFYKKDTYDNLFQLPLMQRRELKFYFSFVNCSGICCLSCRGVNWNQLLFGNVYR